MFKRRARVVDDRPPRVPRTPRTPKWPRSTESAFSEVSNAGPAEPVTASAAAPSLVVAEASLSSPIERPGSDVIEASPASAGPADALSPEEAVKLVAAAKAEAEKQLALDGMQACCTCSLIANNNLFEAPVVTSNGMTYEAASINGRLDSGNTTDPNLSTAAPLNPAVRYINRALIDAMADIKLRLEEGTTGRFESATWKEPITGTCCPITLEPMTDPVIGPSGYSYERSVLEKLIGADGTGLDPIMRDKFRREDFICNTALKNLIQQMTLLQGLTAGVPIKEARAAAGFSDVGAQRFLQLVMEGEQVQAQAFLRAHPEALRELLTGRNTIMNWGGFEMLGVSHPDSQPGEGRLLHEGITALQYLLWCEDVHLYDLIMGNDSGNPGCLPMDANGNLTEEGHEFYALLVEQIREVVKYGLTIRRTGRARPEAPNEAARPTLDRLYAALDELDAAAARAEHDAAVAQGWTPERITQQAAGTLLVEHCRRYDIGEVTRAWEAYVSVFNITENRRVAGFWAEMDVFWLGAIGGAQCTMTANWRQYFCSQEPCDPPEPFRDSLRSNQAFEVRSLKFIVYLRDEPVKHVFRPPQRAGDLGDAGVGKLFALVRGPWRREGVHTPPDAQSRSPIDAFAFKLVDEMRRDEFRQRLACLLLDSARAIESSAGLARR